jgi:hypothetical protein
MNKRKKVVEISVADPEQHRFGKLDPDPHQSEKVEVLEGHLQHWRVQI